MVIAETASRRNIAFKVNMMSEAVLEASAKELCYDARGEGSVTLSARLTHTFLIMKSLSINFSLN